MSTIKSFTLYNEIFRLIDTINPIEKRDDFLGKLMDFYFKDEKPKFDQNSYEETIWLNISKPIISYKTKVTNGSKGGRPKKTESETENNTKNESESETTSDVIVNVNVDNINNLYDFIESNFNRTLNSIEYEEISNWEDNELTRYAIKQTVLNGIYNIKYISIILSSYKQKNITTIQQAQEDSKRFKENKNNSPQRKVPEWIGKQIEEEYLSDEQVELLDKMLRGEIGPDEYENTKERLGITI